MNPSPLALKTLEIALTRIGQKEDPLGSNWGHPVQDWLSRVGIHKPAPWCMAFAWCCVDDAAKVLGLPNPLPRTGGVLDSWRKAGAGHRITHGIFLPGDIFIMDLGKGLGHCGIIETVPDEVTLHTIDGNTDNNGSRNGIDVERKLRHYGHPIIGALRF